LHRSLTNSTFTKCASSLSTTRLNRLVGNQRIRSTSNPFLLNSISKSNSNFSSSARNLIMETASDELKLFYNRLCPYAARAWLALEESGVSYEKEEVGLKVFGQEKPSWYPDLCKAACPTSSAAVGPVPALQLADNRMVLGSRTVVAFIEEFFKIGLSPEDPYLCAQVRMVMDEVESMYSAANQLVANKDVKRDAAYRSALRRAIDNVVALLLHVRKEHRGAPYIFESFTMADVFLAPFLDRFPQVLSELRGFSSMLTDYPIFAELLEAYRGRPSFQNTSQTQEFYLDGYSKKAARGELMEIPDSLKSFAQSVDQDTVLALELQNAEQVKQILREVRPRSWISVLSDGEAHDAKFAFIQEQVASVHNSGEQSVFYTRVPIAPPQLGDEEKDAALALQLVEAVSKAPRPVVLQCATGRRAGLVYSLYSAYLLGGEAKYSSVVEMAEAAGLTWTKMPTLQRFMEHGTIAISHHPECC